MKIKKYVSGTGWVQQYPEVNISSIVATGTPTSSTFLRGDGQWATPPGVDNYVNTTGDTMTGDLNISSSAPTIKLLDTNGTSGYYLHANNSNFYVLKDTTSDGTFDSIPFILTNTGNVGIGTTSPGQKLQVVGNVEVDGEIHINDSSTKISEGGNDSVRITTANGYGDLGPKNGAWFHMETDRASFYMNKPLAVAGDIESYNNPTTRIDNTTGYIYELNNRVLTLAGGTMTGDLTIDRDATGSGATITLANGSEVAGNYSSLMFGNVNAHTNYRKGGIAYRTDGTGYGRGDFYFLQDSGANSSNADLNDAAMVILNNKNVGIGTTSPASLLSLRSSGDTYLTIDTNLNANNAGIRLSESSTPTTNGAELVYDGSANLFHIKTGGASFTERLTIVRDTGLVGIGETSPSAQLQVKSGATDRIPLIVDTLSGQTNWLQQWNVGGAFKSAIDPFGRFSSPLGLANSSNAINGVVYTLTTGVKVERNVADANSALIVNLANASATGDIVKFQKAGTTVATVSNNGEITAPKFYLSADSDGANEIPNWAFSEYNNKPCVSSEYLSDSYYPIYHEGNKPTVDDVTGAQSLQTRYYYDTYGTDSLITNGANGTTSWTKTTGTTTPSNSTGPQSPYTNISGFYYTEASGVNNTLHTMILQVPTIDNSQRISFGFWWHMYGANMGTLTVSYTTNGSTYTDIWTKTGDQGNTEWQKAEVAIPIGTLGIRINGTTGAGFASDMCIANMFIDMRIP